MNWISLINPNRLGCPKGQHDGVQGRTEFHRDFDRIIFSTAFRRLNGKTQVVPFPESDLTHTRLTHSLETASVARSLGNYVKDCCSEELRNCKYDIGALLAATCLCHDIGNPPLGHSGESAIKSFFETDIGNSYLEGLSESQKSDFLYFDGNSMGFHMLTHSNPNKTSVSGGLGLTIPVLSAYCKYPTGTSSFMKTSGDTAAKKPGLFSGDCEIYSDIAYDLGIPKKNSEDRWVRHPLAFLAEAADDICNTIIDYEDGYKIGIIPFTSLNKLFTAIAKAHPETNMDGLRNITTEREKAGFLRAKAINSLTMETVELFKIKEQELLNGTFQESFSKSFSPYDAWKTIQDESRNKLYNNKQVLFKEVAGFEIIPGLLKIFFAAVKDPKKSKHEKILSLLPSDTIQDFEKLQYETIMDITTYICGMTDGYAVDCYRKLTGMQIPNY